MKPRTKRKQMEPNKVGYWWCWDAQYLEWFPVLITRGHEGELVGYEPEMYDLEHNTWGGEAKPPHWTPKLKPPTN